jgi:hypothetical protein
MNLRLSTEEAWAAIEKAHTGIFTTLRADGWPISLPVWFVAMDRTICIGAPVRTKKISRVANDPRASFLVESGERWSELLAVHLTGRVEVIGDDRSRESVRNLLDAKYASSRTATSAMPETTSDHYASMAYLRFIPDDRILSWDNQRIALREQI